MYKSDYMNLSDLLDKETDTLEDYKMGEIDTPKQNIVHNDFVIRQKKKQVVHIVDEVKGIIDDNDHFVGFVNKKSGNIFIFPEIK